MRKSYTMSDWKKIAKKQSDKKKNRGWFVNPCIGDFETETEFFNDSVDIGGLGEAMNETVTLTYPSIEYHSEYIPYDYEANTELVKEELHNILADAYPQLDYDEINEYINNNLEHLVEKYIEQLLVSFYDAALYDLALNNEDNSIEYELYAEDDIYEKLNEIDKATCNEYDLANLYEACKHSVQLNRSINKLLESKSPYSVIGDYLQKVADFSCTTIKSSHDHPIEESLYSDLDDLQLADDVISKVIDEIKKKDCVLYADAEYNYDVSKIILFVTLKDGKEYTNTISLEDLDTLEELYHALKRKFELMTDMCESVSSSKATKRLNEEENDDYSYLFADWSMSDYVDEGDTIYSDGQDYYITEIKDVKNVDGYELAVVEVNSGANIGANVPKKLVGNQDYYYFVLLNGDVEWGVCDTYEEAKDWYDGVEDGYYEESYKLIESLSDEAKELIYSACKDAYDVGKLDFELLNSIYEDLDDLGIGYNEEDVYRYFNRLVNDRDFDESLNDTLMNEDTVKKFRGKLLESDDRLYKLEVDFDEDMQDQEELFKSMAKDRGIMCHLQEKRYFNKRSSDHQNIYEVIAPLKQLEDLKRDFSDRIGNDWIMQGEYYSAKPYTVDQFFNRAADELGVTTRDIYDFIDRSNISVNDFKHMYLVGDIHVSDIVKDKLAEIIRKLIHDSQGKLSIVKLYNYAKQKNISLDAIAYQYDNNLLTIEDILDSLSELKDSLDEDTIKRNGKWVNVGKDGKADSGKFNTKKEADAQRKAMFANGYKTVG